MTVQMDARAFVELGPTCRNCGHISVVVDSCTPGRVIRGDCRSQLRTILFDYIEVFYNRSRHQRALDDCTPAETYAASRAA